MYRVRNRNSLREILPPQNMEMVNGFRVINHAADAIDLVPTKYYQVIYDHTSQFIPINKLCRVPDQRMHACAEDGEACILRLAAFPASVNLL